MKKIISILIICIALSTYLFAQKGSYTFGVAFYNIENLFDTINDPNKNDEEFLPDGIKKWTSDKYFKKLDNIAYVIDQLNKNIGGKGVVFIGLSEVENINVLKDLVKREHIAKYRYIPILIEGPDRRGVDVGFLFRPDYFKLIKAEAKNLYIPENPNFKTRNQLVIKGLLFEQDTVFVIVNHWPSRSGGEKRSAPLRAAAAQLCRKTVDSILAVNSNAQIFIMGDFNDTPTNASILKILKAAPTLTEAKKTNLYNPYYDLQEKKGLGSYAYNDVWSFLDQIIITYNIAACKSNICLKNACVFNKPFLLQTEGNFAGYPLRTFVGNNFMGGYSDHFPVYLLLEYKK
ncbi:MAG: endonuclease/exonuclease/phosphatase family protein [Bacteroidales bacterium]|nr:endonuclease/exonuclease/phosphatase family protein [Bacteroidales bacterium]